MAETVDIAARGLAAGRAALGAALLVRPELVTRPWIGTDGSSPGGRALARGFGARDIVIGVAVLAGGDDLKRAAVAGGILADASDAAAALLEKSEPKSGRMLTLAIASSATLIGIWAFTQLD